MVKKNELRKQCMLMFRTAYSPCECSLQSVLQSRISRVRGGLESHLASPLFLPSPSSFGHHHLHHLLFFLLVLLFLVVASVVAAALGDAFLLHLGQKGI